jgi:DNA-binding FrmR family transcriptional regulator
MSKNCHIVDEQEHEENKKKLINRANRIEGQIKGIKKMLEDDIYCDDVLNQISSVKAALNGLGKALLERHMNTCVINKIKSDDESVIPELLSTISKMLKH